MTKRRRRRSGERTIGRGGEWVGACLEAPFFVTDREPPYRPALIVWMDLADGLVVGQDVAPPEQGEAALVGTLLEALERPLAGPRRRPARIRVAEPAWAEAIREALGPGTRVDVAATPELDALLELMTGSMGAPGLDDDEEAEEESYFEGGRVSADSIARMFEAAKTLYQVAPWETLDDRQVVRLDAPAFGVSGACVSCIGRDGEARGLVIFPSLAGFEAFLRAAEQARPRSGRLDLGTTTLAITFEAADQLPPGMRREAMRHGWPVASPDAYPRVEARERDGLMRPLLEREVALATAVAAAFPPFFLRHTGVFAREAFESACESYFDDGGTEIRFTLPFEAADEFDVGVPDGEVPTDGARRKVGRNDPCPCGSGRKYKKCHLAADEAGRNEVRSAEADREMADRLTDAMLREADASLGHDWHRFAGDFDDRERAAPLAIPWSLYHFHVRGTTAAEWYLERRGSRLSPRERQWIDAERAAWLSVWEVIGVVPGESLTLLDLLSGEERQVREVRGSRGAMLRDALLGRVVDHDTTCLLGGNHPRLLAPRDAAEVVRRARGRLRRKTAVPVDRLRDEAFGRYLIQRWEEAVDEADDRRAVPPRLTNTDGDAILLTLDHFDLEPGARAEIEERLRGLDGVEGDDEEDGDDGESVLVVSKAGNTLHADWENTVIGQVCVSDARLRTETNSRERADALRARIEAAAGPALRHRAREHPSPRIPGPPADPPAPVPGAEALVLEHKRRHYATWPDHPLPALGGATPREAARTAKGREALELLLKEMEHHEQRWSGGAPFDFGELRRALGLA